MMKSEEMVQIKSFERKKIKIERTARFYNQNIIVKAAVSLPKWNSSARPLLLSFISHFSSHIRSTNSIKKKIKRILQIQIGN